MTLFKKFFFFLFALAPLSLSAASTYTWGDGFDVTGAQGSLVAMANYQANNTAIGVYATGTQIEAVYFDGVSWSAPETVVTAAFQILDLTLAIDQTSGHALVGYTIRSGATNGQVFATYYDGATWAAPFAFPVFNNNARFASVAFYDGVGGMLYINLDGLDQTRLSGGYFDESTTTWTTQASILIVSSLGDEPDVSGVAVDITTGNLLGIVKSADLFQLISVEATPGSGYTWTSTGPISTTEAFQYQLVAGGGGNTWAIWLNSQSTQIEAARYNGAEGGWQPLEVLSTAGNAGRPKIATNLSDASAAAVWQELVHQQISAKRYDGTNWVGLQVLETAGGGQEVLAPSIAINSDTNDILTIWTWTDGGTTETHSAFFDGAWDDLGTIQNFFVTQTELVRNNNLIFNPNGQGVALGSVNQGQLMSVIGLAVPVVVLPPSNLVGRITYNRFPTETVVGVVLNWTASPTPNVVYLVRRDGVLIATTAETMYVDRHLPAGVPVTYSITAFDGTTESTPVTIVITP